MYKVTVLSILVSMMLLFSACANMEVGFDEDSVFSSKPAKKNQKLTESSVKSKIKNTPPSPEEDPENETTFEYNINYGYE